MGKLLRWVQLLWKRGLLAPTRPACMMGMVALVGVFALLSPSRSAGQDVDPTAITRFQRPPTSAPPATSQDPNAPSATRFRRAPTRTATSISTSTPPPTTTSVRDATATDAVRFLRASTRTATMAVPTPTATPSRPATATIESVRFQRRTAEPVTPFPTSTPYARFVRATRTRPTIVVENLPSTSAPKGTPSPLLIPPMISRAPKQEYKIDELIVVIGTGNPGSKLQILVEQVIVDTTFIDDDGVWGWRFQPEEAGTYEISVVDVSRVFSDRSDPVMLIVTE